MTADHMAYIMCETVGSGNELHAFPQDGAEEKGGEQPGAFPECTGAPQDSQCLVEGFDSIIK